VILSVRMCTCRDKHMFVRHEIFALAQPYLLHYDRRTLACTFSIYIIGSINLYIILYLYNKYGRI
jgi:hypothetical protein